MPGVYNCNKTGKLAGAANKYLGSPPALEKYQANIPCSANHRLQREQSVNRIARHAYNNDIWHKNN
jgi:hypothetical protein